MTKIYLTTEQVANLLGISQNSVHQSVCRGTQEHIYIDGVGQGGKQLRIPLDSLPQYAQDKYNGIETKKPAESIDFDILTKKQRDRAEEKEFAVLEYLGFKKRYHKKDCRKAFLKEFKEDYPEIDITYGKLEDWVNKYAEFGRSGLIDTRGGKNKGTTSVSEELQQEFLYYYLSDKKPAIQKCYDVIKLNHEDEPVPSISAFKRFLSTVPSAQIALYREGKKYFSDHYLPYIATDYLSNDLNSNDEWIADHHIYDVMTNYNGRAVRPWLSIWFDRHSRAVVGYVINPCDPNADIVLDSFYDAVMKHGVPNRVQIDNGKDYKVHDLFNIDNAQSLANVMRLAVRVSLPYNAKAKSVERLFKSLEEYNKLLPSYVGNRPDNRPESMKELNKNIVDKIMTYDDFIQYAENCITEYNNHAHSGKGMNGSTPKEVYESSFVSPVRVLPAEELRAVMRRTTNPVTVTRNGVTFRELQGVQFRSEKLLEHIGEKVFAKYDTKDVTVVALYNANGSYLCSAKMVESYNYADTEEIKARKIRELNNLKKAQNRLARKSNYKPAKSIEDTIAESASRLNDIDISALSKEHCLDYEKRQEIKTVLEDQRLLKNGNKPQLEDKTIDENELMLNLSNLRVAK